MANLSRRYKYLRARVIEKTLQAADQARDACPHALSIKLARLALYTAKDARHGLLQDVADAALEDGTADADRAAAGAFLCPFRRLECLFRLFAGEDRGTGKLPARATTQRP